MRMQITVISAGDHLSDVETILTAIVFIGSIVAILHAIAVSVTVDALPVSAYEFGRRTSCTQKEIDYYIQKLLSLLPKLKLQHFQPISKNPPDIIVIMMH